MFDSWNGDLGMVFNPNTTSLEIQSPISEYVAHLKPAVTSVNK